MFTPEKVGSPVPLFPRKHSKTAYVQWFRNPTTGKKDDFIIFHSTAQVYLIFAVTEHHEVVAIRQFRHAADCNGVNPLIIEIPGGKAEPSETPVEAARRELKDETGHEAGQMILIDRPFLPDPCSFDFSFKGAFIALNCRKVAALTLDDTEHIEVLLVPIQEWLRMAFDELIDLKTVAITLAALPHIGVKIAYRQ